MREMIGDASPKGGDRKKREVWARVLECRANIGYPYIFFPDAANRNAPDCYRKNNITIKHTNLCVTGDQRVVSDRGLKTAKELYEESGELKLFDNDKVISSSPMRLVEKNADVYRITLENGMTHTVTGYHKVKVLVGQNWKNRLVFEDVPCTDLKAGDLVAVQTKKGLFGKRNEIDKAFLLGLYQGDGTQTEELRMIDVWEKDFDLLDEIQDIYDRVCAHNNTQFSEISQRIYETPKFVDCVVAQSNVKKKRLVGRALAKLGFEKGVIPNWIWDSTEETQWAYIKGLFYTDGTVFVSKSEGNPIQLSLASIDKEWLKQVQILLSNLGMQNSIRILREAGEQLLPDGKGGQKLYNTKDCYRLIIGNKNDAIVFNDKTGFLDRKNVSIERKEYRDNTKKFYAVESIEHVGKEDVYCCTVESDEHHWVCNGVVTHNCTEIMLPNDEFESFVCDLSSMNILYYDEWKGTDAVELMVYFLDAVMSEFIRKAKKIQFMERPVRFAERHRALGIGWLGWHTYLQSKMIPWESMEAKTHNVMVAKNIRNSAYAASAKMATEYGEPEVLKGFGRRHATLLAIAPTKSSAFILGQVSEGIEPHRTNHYIKDLQKGKYTIRNTQLAEVLASHGKDNDFIWLDILKKGGTVQHLDFLSEHEKAVFKTFAEISQKEVIIQAAQRQKYIDQGQSLNLMIHPSIPTKEVNALMIEGWKMDIKSYYYQNSVNAAQTFARNILACTNCEA
jgi:ribonucleoside-diphosphate reductase alpha chain